MSSSSKEGDAGTVPTVIADFQKMKARPRLLLWALKLLELLKLLLHLFVVICRRRHRQIALQLGGRSGIIAFFHEHQPEQVIGPGIPVLRIELYRHARALLGRGRLMQVEVRNGVDVPGLVEIHLIELHSLIQIFGGILPLLLTRRHDPEFEIRGDELRIGGHGLFERITSGLRLLTGGAEPAQLHPGVRVCGIDSNRLLEILSGFGLLAFVQGCEAVLIGLASVLRGSERSTADRETLNRGVAMQDNAAYVGIVHRTVHKEIYVIRCITGEARPELAGADRTAEDATLRNHAAGSPIRHLIAAGSVRGNPWHTRWMAMPGGRGAPSAMTTLPLRKIGLSIPGVVTGEVMEGEVREMFPG